MKNVLSNLHWYGAESYKFKEVPFSYDIEYFVWYKLPFVLHDYTWGIRDQILREF